MGSLLVLKSLVSITIHHIFLILVEVLFKKLSEKTILLGMTGTELLSLRKLIILEVLLDRSIELLLLDQEKD